MCLVAFPQRLWTTLEGSYLVVDWVPTTLLCFAGTGHGGIRHPGHLGLV
jgi:hypothetical protein